jgi:Lon protease-like protein
VTVTPMFPLGLVHFPGVMLPLRVFEPRYRQLTIDCLDGDREFGVVLIERGSEVGGGDVRTAVGTMTSIVQAGLDESGLIRLDTIGTRRIRVLQWLDDEPYPRAEVEDLPAHEVGAEHAGPMATVERKVRRALALRTELGERTMPYNIELDPDAARALFQLAAIAPLGPLDQQRLLAAPGPAELLSELDRFMDEELAVLASRLAGN